MENLQGWLIKPVALQVLALLTVGWSVRWLRQNLLAPLKVAHALLRPAPLQFPRALRYSRN